VENEIHRQDLIIPFDIELRHEKRYCFVYPEHKKDSRLVQLFCDWLLERKQEFNTAPAPAATHQRKSKAAYL